MEIETAKVIEKFGIWAVTEYGIENTTKIFRVAKSDLWKSWKDRVADVCVWYEDREDFDRALKYAQRYWLEQKPSAKASPLGKPKTLVMRYGDIIMSVMCAGWSEKQAKMVATMLTREGVSVYTSWSAEEIVDLWLKRYPSRKLPKPKKKPITSRTIHPAPQDTACKETIISLFARSEDTLFTLSEIVKQTEFPEPEVLAVLDQMIKECFLRRYERQGGKGFYGPK